MRFFVTQFDELRQQFADRVDFLMVYIEEAHAEDEWPVRSARYNDGVPVRVNQPRTLSDRLAIATEFVSRFKLMNLPTLVDDPEKGNLFSSAFAPWPIRFYVVHKGKMCFIANPVNCEYSIRELRDAIER